MIMNTLIRIRSRDVAIDMYKGAINIGVLQLEFAWAMRYAGYTRAGAPGPAGGRPQEAAPARANLVGANLTEATSQALDPYAGQAVVRQNR